MCSFYLNFALIMNALYQVSLLCQTLECLKYCELMRFFLSYLGIQYMTVSELLFTSCTITKPQTIHLQASKLYIYRPQNQIETTC